MVGNGRVVIGNGRVVKSSNLLVI